MWNKLLNYAARKPELYEGSTSKFWDDPHISKGMLEAHLNPEWDAATRNHNFISKSVEWIGTVANPVNYPRLLDLGCGPGIYAERFYQRGYHVTGMDLSTRSIEYATHNAKINEKAISYLNQNYLDMTYQEEFDVVTLIYCDLSVMSKEERTRLLKCIYQALKPNGQFILDVFTPEQYRDREETKEWYYSEGGFWNENGHICLNSFYRYDDNNTMLEQTVVITEDAIECYNIWDHVFIREELELDLKNAGFTSVNIYGDVAGAGYHSEGKTMCAVARK